MLVIAHRGASAVAPESTWAALEAAVEAGADMVELDIQMTRDQRLVVFHDERLERTTNGTGRLSEQDYAALSRLDAGGWFHPRFAGQRILLASEVARRLPQRVRINFELKSTTRPGPLLRAVGRLIQRYHLRRRVVLSSFDRRLLAPWPRQGITCGLICSTAPQDTLRQAIHLGCRSWHPRQHLVTPGRIALAHQAGLRVYAWTVNTRAQAQRLRQWGVDGIFTDHPAAVAA